MRFKNIAWYVTSRKIRFWKVV